MVVKLDLRLPGKETREERESGYKHLLLFTSVFIFAIAGTLVFTVGGWQLYSLRTQRQELKDGAFSNSRKIAIMDKELGRITGDMSILESKIDYMLSDIPSVELLTALAKILPEGITIETLSMTSGRLSLSGIGRNEEEILQFANDLHLAPFANIVSVPVISPANRNGVNMRSFKLDCTLFPIEQIILKSDVNGLKQQKIVSEDKVL
jgi:hypothetical protein